MSSLFQEKDTANNHFHESFTVKKDLMRKLTIWNQPWILSSLSALLLSLSFPPIDLAVLQIPAFILLFRLGEISRSKREYILYAYPALVVWNLVVTYWLMMATIPGGLAAIVANAAIMLIPLLVIRSVLSSEMHPVTSAVVAAAIWVSYEFLHHNWDLAWPWLTLGNGWSNQTTVIQYISVTGVLGISFWIVAASALFYRSISNQSRFILYCAVAVLLIFPIFSMISSLSMPDENGESLVVAIVQPNSDSYDEPYGGHATLDDLLTKILMQTGTVVSDETDVIIWPENAIMGSLPMQNRYFNRIRDSLRVWETELITGSGFVEYFPEPDSLLVHRTTGNGTAYKIYNAAFNLHPSEANDVYRKGKLVPIVERFPFVDFFYRIDRFGWVDWGSLMGYGLGQESLNFTINSHNTPALICYDSVFPGWVNQFVHNGADFLTIITNDGWWGDSFGHLQHFAYARLRAIEQRRWIARAANNGISGIISPDGKIRHETEYWTEDAFTYRITASEYKTIYARYGEWFGQMMLIVAFGGFVIYGISGRKQDHSDDFV